MRKALFLLPLSGLVFAQLTNFFGAGNPVSTGNVTTRSQLQTLLATRGEMHLVVPQATDWTFYLAGLHAPYGSVKVYVQRPEARRLCRLSGGNPTGNYALVQVLATENPPTPMGMILPPDGSDLKGVLLEGDGLYKEMVLVDLPDPLAAWYNLVGGPKRGRAYVTGSPSQGNLRADVYLQEEVWERSDYPELVGTFSFTAPWNGTFTADLGKGPETLTLSGYSSSTQYSGTTLRVLDASGQDIGYAVLTSQGSRRVVGVDTSTVRTGGGCGNYWNGMVFTADVGGGPETFYLANCYRWGEGFLGILLRGGCDIYDSEGRLRGAARSGGGRTYYGFFLLYGANYCWLGTAYDWQIYPLKYEYRKTSESVVLYARKWRKVVREVYKGNFAVLPGGKVYVEGSYYSIPELAGYLNTNTTTLKFAKDSPLVSYLAKQIGLDRGSNAGDFWARQAGAQTPEKPKPLGEFCRLNR